MHVVMIDDTILYMRGKTLCCAVSTLSNISCVPLFFHLPHGKDFTMTLADIQTHKDTQNPHCLTQQMFQWGNNILFLQSEVAVSDASSPFPGQPTYTPDNGFHHFSFEQQQKYKRCLDLFPRDASLRKVFMPPLAPM